MELIKNCECCNNEIKIKYVKCTYTESQKKAIMNYRENNPNKNKDNAKAYYNKMKEDPEWRAKKFERSRINNKKYYEKKKLLRNEVDISTLI